MPTEEPRNLLVNPSFREGATTPEGWAWRVVSGRPIWAFDEEVARGSGRSVKIIQDVGNIHGEFSQRVPCEGGRRYRLTAQVKVALEGTGEDSGANLCLTSYRGDEEAHQLSFRPFFVGREGWQLWSADYVTPEDADALVVTFDMRRSDGIAWFSDLRLFEAPEPLAASVRPPQASSNTAVAPRRPERVGVYSDRDTDFLCREVLEPLLGRPVGDWALRGLEQSFEDDARIIWGFHNPKWLSIETIARDAQKRLVIITPGVFVDAARSKRISLGISHDDVSAPCARIEKESFLTRGLRRGDVVPWSAGEMTYHQQMHVKARGRVLEEKGFEVIATSVCRDGEETGHPVILWRPVGKGGGILVMDVGILNSRPAYTADENVACLVLSNALGRPQTSLGTYVVPPFDYERFVEDLQTIAKAHPLIELKEEGRSAEGRPIYSLAIGPKDAPTFFADAGIHPYEWAPCYGLAMYVARLAEEYERGLPWAKALLANLRFKCVPIYAPDGWASLARGLRGVNLNRNFPAYWDDYRGGDKGKKPLSEPETRLVAGILERENIVSAVSWHETSANTNWVGMPGFDGRYAGYARATREFFKRHIDGSHFYWQAATWTQVTDPRNFHYHYTDSYPWLRDYNLSKEPFQLHYSESLGITSFLVEQYGNSEMYYSATPQRTDMTGRIVEMLFGYEIGLVCRNHGAGAVEASLPLVGQGDGRAIVYAADGSEAGSGTVTQKDGTAWAQGVIPPGGCLVAELEDAPWKAHARARREAGGKK